MEYKFRGKSPYGKSKWRYGDLLHMAGKPSHIQSLDGLNKDDRGVYRGPMEIIPETAGILIHKDVDAGDIYAGDIIEDRKHGRIVRVFVAEDVRTFAREYDRSEHSSVWKVIGNIHDNPELMKGGE
jgi:hypothetical protein